jgi:hypothetical protein
MRQIPLYLDGMFREDIPKEAILDLTLAKAEEMSHLDVREKDISNRRQSNSKCCEAGSIF